MRQFIQNAVNNIFGAKRLDAIVAVVNEPAMGMQSLQLRLHHGADWHDAYPCAFAPAATPGVATCLPANSRGSVLGTAFEAAKNRTRLGSLRRDWARAVTTG